jgi:hypothetical protein
MNRTVRNVLGAAFLIALAACAFDIAFDMAKDITADGVGTSLSTVQSIDLSQYKEVQDHKGNITHLQLQSVEATVLSLGTANAAHTVSGKMSLRASTAPADGSQDVLVGQVTLPVTVGGSFHLAGSAAVDDFLMQQLQGPGTFYVVISGSADGEPHLTLHAVLHANLGYNAGF